MTWTNLDCTKGLGKSNSKAHHDFFEDHDSEDIDHVVTLKRTIVAITEYLKSESIQEDKINTLTGYYKKISRGLYISACISNKNYDAGPGPRQQIEMV